MRILIDITHPAYAHFFRAVLPALRERGHQLCVTSRDKDLTVALLEAFGIEHQCLSTAGRTRWQLLTEMIVRVRRLRRVIREFAPHVILARDGAFACQAGWLTGVPAISFDDTDDAPIQHHLYFPCAWRIYTDRAYGKSIGRRHRFYKGVSCLAYLHPTVFQPDPEVLRRAGLATGEPLILCRMVSWTSNHDYKQYGIGLENLSRLRDRLTEFGRVLISSEVELPVELERHRVTLPPHEIHHLMAHCSLYLGESPTMAAECAVLGVPAIHVSTRRLWYTDELERTYQLVQNVDNTEPGMAAALRILQDQDYLQLNRQRRDRYLQATDDLVSVVVNSVEEVSVG